MLGLEDDIGVQNVMDTIAQQQQMLAEQELEWMESGSAAVARLPDIRRAGTRQHVIHRSDVSQKLASHYLQNNKYLNQSEIVTIHSMTTDTVFIDRTLATHALRKYQRFAQKQDLLVQALQQFGNPEVQMQSNGENAYRYTIDTQSHGSCTVEFEFAENRVTRLRVRSPADRTLVSMRKVVYSSMFESAGEQR